MGISFHWQTGPRSHSTWAASCAFFPLDLPAPRFSPSQISSLLPVTPSSPWSASDDRNSVERPFPFSSYPPICTRSSHSLLERGLGWARAAAKGGAVACRLQRRLGVEVGQSSGFMRGPAEGGELELYPMKDLLRLGMKNTAQLLCSCFFSVVAAGSARSKSIDKLLIACPRSWSCYDLQSHLLFAQVYFFSLLQKSRFIFLG